MLLHIEKLAPKTAVVFGYGKIISQYAETKQHNDFRKKGIE